MTNMKLCTFLALSVAVLWLGTWMRAQQGGALDVSRTVLPVVTRLVVVDAVVTDKQGRPVTGLTAEDFTLLEDRKPQRIAVFAFEDTVTNAPNAEAEPSSSPRAVYTNRQEYPDGPAPLAILLFDFLNTSLRDQAYAREQMLRYLASEVKPNQQTAILALTHQLVVLQDFTTNPQLLQTAVQNAAPSQSVELTKAEPIQVPPEVIETIPQAANSLERLERLNLEQLAITTDARVQTTLGALRTIAQRVAGYRGRKNLIWVSAGFPIALVPEEAKDFDLYRSYAPEMRNIAVLLADANVAIYPIDARGLVGLAGADLLSRNRPRQVDTIRRRGEPDRADEDLTRRLVYVESAHMTMNQLAADSGGRAFVNRSDLDAAIREAMADSSAYYTLGYYPDDKKWDGKFRRVLVKVARKGVQVRHRRGYYAVDRAQRSERSADNTAEELWTALRSPLASTAITFQIGVDPPAPTVRGDLWLDLLVDTSTLIFVEAEDGSHTFSLDFVAATFAPDEKVVATSSQRVEGRLPVEPYTRFQRDGLPYRLRLQLEPGRYELRVLVRDNHTGLLGRIDVPLALEKAN